MVSGIFKLILTFVNFIIILIATIKTIAGLNFLRMIVVARATFAILERRANLGGTWDFMKYPGIRSDSDMYTFGFSWKIWKSAKPIATSEEILK